MNTMTKKSQNTTKQTVKVPTVQKMPKIYIAIPAMNEVYTEFANDLAHTTAFLARMNIETHLGFSIGSVITVGRRALVEQFLKTDCDYLWWLDSDMKFPPDTAIKLMNRNKDIVGCNYRRRRFPDASFVTLVGELGNFKALETTDKSPPLELCDAIPHGCVLIKRRVYEKMAKPYYVQEWRNDIDREISEDVYFSLKAKESGFEIWIDHDISRSISHIGTLYFNYNLTT